MLMKPDSQPSDVGPAGVVIEVPVPHRQMGRRIERIVVSHTSGSCHNYSVEVSEDPDFDDPLMRVVGYDSREGLTTIDDNNGGNGFTHAMKGRSTVITNPDGSKTRVLPKLYVRIVPDFGNDNQFLVGIYGELV